MRSVLTFILLLAALHAHGQNKAENSDHYFQEKITGTTDSGNADRIDEIHSDALAWAATLR